MQQIQDGQCGLCLHFGEHHAGAHEFVTLRREPAAAPALVDETVVDECSHPRHAPLHLKVTPISGCEGFAPAVTA